MESTGKSVITLTGIDLAKEVVEVRCEDAESNKIKGQSLKRENLIPFLQKLPKGSTVVMEACGSANHYARECQNLGLIARLIAPQHVKRFRIGQKNDKNDATAICLTARQKGVPSVSIKSAEQLEMQRQHRMREKITRDRTATINQIHGFVYDQGLILKKGGSNFKARVEEIVTKLGEDSDFGVTLKLLLEQFEQFTKWLGVLTKKIYQAVKTSEPVKKIMELSGIGPIVGSALVAHIGDPSSFKNGRCFAASLGLVARQHSTGGKPMLGGITKSGDSYIRKQLIHGARSAVRAAMLKTTSKDPHILWIQQLQARAGTNRTAVAVANKTARCAWAILAGKQPFVQPLPKPVAQ